MIRVRDRVVSAIDHYAIERELGRGSAASVYLARDTKHDRLVALKVLHPELSAALGAERFQREIQLLARLQHPHILPLYDSGEIDGTLYYVMPYIEGESLRARLDREGRLPVDAAVRIARELLGALAHAHGQEVVHRDIKPENVLLAAGQPILADFGIARAIGRASRQMQRLTGAGMIVGTPAYMSPEQASADPVIDGRSDIYALGCVLYEMLTGRTPFAGSSPQRVIANRFVSAPPPVRELRREVPPAVEAALLRALAPSPDERWQTADAFAEALVRQGVWAAPADDRALARGVVRWRWLGAALAAAVALALLARALA